MLSVLWIPMESIESVSCGESELSGECLLGMEDYHGILFFSWEEIFDL